MLFSPLAAKSDKVYFDFSEQPSPYFSVVDGKAAGFLVELSTVICERTNITCEFPLTTISEASVLDENAIVASLTESVKGMSSVISDTVYVDRVIFAIPKKHEPSRYITSSSLDEFIPSVGQSLTYLGAQYPISYAKNIDDELGEKTQENIAVFGYSNQVISSISNADKMSGFTYYSPFLTSQDAGGEVEYGVEFSTENDSVGSLVEIFNFGLGSVVDDGSYDVLNGKWLPISVMSAAACSQSEVWYSDNLSTRLESSEAEIKTDTLNFILAKDP